MWLLSLATQPSTLDDQWDKQLLLHTFAFTSFVFEASFINDAKTNWRATGSGGTLFDETIASEELAALAPPGG